MDLSTCTQKVRGNLQSLFFPLLLLRLLYYTTSRETKEGTPKTLKLPTPPLKKGSSILTPNNKNSSFPLFCVITKSHANEAQKNTQRTPLVDGLSIVLFDRRRDFDERRLCDDDVNDDTFEQKKKKKKNDFDDAVVPPARDHQKRDIIENDNQSATKNGRL